MKLRHIALALGFAVAFASHAVAQDECRQLTISDTPPLDRIVIDPLTADDEDGVKWSGTATLYLDDDTPVALEASRKFRKRQGTWKYKLKTPKKAKPKCKVTAELGGDPEAVVKCKIQFKGAVKVKQKDPAKVTLEECADPNSTSFTVGPAGGSFDAAEGKVSFFFPTGSVTEDTTITVTPVAPPAGTDFITGSTYRFEPDMSFLQPVDLTISYDEAAITVDESDLRLAKFLEGDPAEGNQRLWVHSGVDTVNDRVTGFITGFSITASFGGGLPPPPPRMSTDVNQDNSVEISWTTTPATTILVERVYRADGLQRPSWGGATTYHLGSHLSPWTDSGPATNPGVGVYHYRVRAVSANGVQSAPSAYERVIILGPTQPPAWDQGDALLASASGCGGVIVSWPPLIEASAYRLERKEPIPSGPPYVVVANLPGVDLWHVDTTALPSTHYMFRIIGMNTAGESGGLTAAVTTSSTEYTVSLSSYDLTIAPGDSIIVTAQVNWGGVPPSDVTLSVTSDSTRVTAEFLPSGTTQDQAELHLTVDAGAPGELQAIVQVASAGTCEMPPLVVTVQGPESGSPSGPTLDSLDPEWIPADAPGFEIALHGSGFVEGAVIHIDGTLWAEVEFRDATKLVSSLPSIGQGQHKVKVVNPDGGESSELDLFAD